MKYDNLTHADKLVADAAVLRSHRRRREVRIYTLDDEFVQSVTGRFLGGEVTGDDSQSPSRVATVDLVNPSTSLVFEPDDAGGESFHRKYKVEIVELVQVMELDGEWVEQTVIYGPVWDYSRQGGLVHLEVDGSDRLLMGSVRKGHAWLRKTRMTDVIVGLVRAAGGRDYRIPDLKKTTPVHVHIGVVRHKGKDGELHKRKHRKVRGFTTHHTDTYLSKIEHLAKALDRHFYPDAEGTFRLRTTPKRPRWRFTGRSLLAEPTLDRPTREGPNTWIVLGAKPKGSRRRVSSGKVGFGPHHPAGAVELAWHGEPYQVIDERTNQHVKTKAGARKIARRLRDDHRSLLVDVTIDAVPIPWVVAHERFRVSAGARWGLPVTTVHQWTYPLGEDASPMTLGAVRRAVPRVKTRRHRTMGSEGVS